MGYQSRKTTLQLPGGIPLPVSITGVQDSAPIVNNFCTEGHDPQRVRSTTGCPTCNNTDRATFKRGVQVGESVEWVAEPDEKADHSISQLTAHNADEVDGLSMTVGKVYAVLPQKGGEQLYANLRAFIVANPKVAVLTTWGWTTTKTSIWRLDVQLDKVLMREITHPNDVRPIAGPTDASNDVMVGMLGQLLAPESFSADTYADNNAAAKAAAAGAGVTAAKAPKAAAPDLMALLAGAVEKKKPIPAMKEEDNVIKTTTPKKKDSGSEILDMLRLIDAGCTVLGIKPEDFKAMTSTGQNRVIEAGRQSLGEEAA